MIYAILDVIGPVALIIALGYTAVRTNIFPVEGVPYITKYFHNFAVPLLLFNAVRGIDLGQSFDPKILASYFIPAFAVFMLGIFSARKFGKGPQASVVLAFCALFSNSVYIGIPITERAYGQEALIITFVIISVHSVFCYVLGSVAIQVARPDRQSWGETVKMIVLDLIQNPLILGVIAGFTVNILSIKLPNILNDTIAMQARAALPVALFGLGGVLTKLKLRGEMRVMTSISFLRLFIHPALVLILGYWVFKLPLDIVQVLVLIAAASTGTNGFIFAALYKREEESTASIVFVTTLLCVITLPFWMIVLELL